ncbi:MAG TPA: hypothetical protein VMF89_30310 [Polyangiales bacterium]|nr:hypothetical protein [Polyangiales bacterium]
MTQHDPEAWLDLARQALAPREADCARVLSALEQRLDLPSNDVPSELARKQPHELHSMQASTSSLPLGIPSAVVRWALSAVVPLTAAAAIGVFVSTRTATPKVPVLRPATGATAAVTEPSLPDMLDQTIAQVKEATEPKPVEPAPLPPKEKKHQHKKCRTAKGSERPCTTVKATETAIAVVNDPPPPAAAPPSSLSKELAALREAQRALREGQAAHALSVLTSFEQASPGPGAMQEERHAAATMARCALAQRGETKQLYEEFMQRYPKSAYAARLQRTCLPKSAR